MGVYQIFILQEQKENMVVYFSIYCTITDGSLFNIYK